MTEQLYPRRVVKTLNKPMTIGSVPIHYLLPFPIIGIGLLILHSLRAGLAMLLQRPLPLWGPGRFLLIMLVSGVAWLIICRGDSGAFASKLLLRPPTWTRRRQSLKPLSQAPLSRSRGRGST